MSEEKNLAIIENAKGLLLTPDGTIHPFGELKYATVSELEGQNEHDSAFLRDIATKPWFQQLEQELGFKYKLDNKINIHRQTPLMSGKGIVIILNDSSLTAQDEEYNWYTFQFPETITQAQQEVLENSYQALKQLIEKKHSYVDGMAYDTNGNDAWSNVNFNVDNLDEIYDRMNLNKSIGKKR